MVLRGVVHSARYHVCWWFQLAIVSPLPGRYVVVVVCVVIIAVAAIIELVAVVAGKILRTSRVLFSVVPQMSLDDVVDV